MKCPPLRIWQIYGVGAAACAAWSLGAWLLFVSPALAQAREQANLRQTLFAGRQNAARIASELKLNQRDLATARASVSAMAIRLDSPEAINERIAGISNLASQCGLVIAEVRPGAAAPSPHFQAIPIHLAGTGSYPACAAFLHHLHQAFPDIGVQSLQALNASSATEAPKIVVQFELTWYAKK